MNIKLLVKRFGLTGLTHFIDCFFHGCQTKITLPCQNMSQYHLSSYLTIKVQYTCTYNNQSRLNYSNNTVETQNTVPPLDRMKSSVF